MTEVEEICPFCESTVGADDSYCATCGESLVEDIDDEYDEYDEYDDFDYGDDYDDSVEDPDDVAHGPGEEVLADTGAGDEGTVVYAPRSRVERRDELKLLAVVLAVAIVVLGLLGLVLGWFSGGDSADEADVDGDAISDAQAVDVSSADVDETGENLPEAVGVDRLEGLSVAVRDRTGVHLFEAGGSDPIHLVAAPRVANLGEGQIAIVSGQLFYVDGATVRRHDPATGADEEIAEADWVAAVPGDSEALWLVDRREDDEVGSLNILLRTDLDGAVSGEVELPQGAQLVGPTSRGVIVTDPVTGDDFVIGPDGFGSDVAASPSAPAGSVVSPDGRWVLRAAAGKIVARPADGAADDEFDVVLVPSQPAVPAEFVVVATPGS